MMFHLVRYRSLRRGFTIWELLLIVAIIAVIAVAIMISMRTQATRSIDIKRKTDLRKLKTAFEEYFNDHDCYPTHAEWDAFTCDGANQDFLAKYFSDRRIPCDPQFNTKYLYVSVSDTNPCAGYKLLATLKDFEDRDIIAQGCNPYSGCGYGAYYNYGVSEGGPIAAAGFDPSIGLPTNTPIPIPTPTLYSVGSIYCVYSINDGLPESPCQDKGGTYSHPEPGVDIPCNQAADDAGCQPGFANGTVCNTLCRTQNSTFFCKTAKECY